MYSENETIDLLKDSIWKAISDYREHTSRPEVLDNITDSFVNRLAEDSFHSKYKLRELLRRSPAWDENLHALVINGTRTHNPDYTRIFELAHDILKPAIDKMNNISDYELLKRAVHFFSRPNDNCEECIKAISALAPNAYKKGKKKSRIFKSLCDALGVTDESKNSVFQRNFALFADEITSRKINFKLFLSINPAHFLTMSNPKHDNRGTMLTSCHSLNSTDYAYNCGCSGYARDNVTMIAFTVANPDDDETLNNRKTTRQLFMYKVGNGLLLQSRFYNTSGGTTGAQEDSKLYRDLIQREISALEGVPNLWKTYSYCDNKKGCVIHSGIGFGGYPDWIYSDFAPRISIRADHADDYKTFEVGSYGLCIVCGSETCNGLYCENCNQEHHFCEECQEQCEETFEVHDNRGNIIHVCEYCRDDYYAVCEHCDDFYALGRMTFINESYHVCPYCLDEYYSQCEECGEYVHRDDICDAYDYNGRPTSICGACLEDSYETCNSCGEWNHTDNLDEDGICPNCRNEN